VNLVIRRSRPSSLRQGFAYFFIGTSRELSGLIRPQDDPDLVGFLMHDECHFYFSENKTDRSSS
jgi:hypothetical protein